MCPVIAICSFFLANMMMYTYANATKYSTSKSIVNIVSYLQYISTFNLFATCTQIYSNIKHGAIQGRTLLFDNTYKTKKPTTVVAHVIDRIWWLPLISTFLRRNKCPSSGAVLPPHSAPLIPSPLLSHQIYLPHILD
ncbi:hypothetical protein L6452_00889 [Arctium lappa]|uniref:Uncharacterized protein n=1 Tax=Arctium lappa TaxID=4217 RepID=A0ACB9FFK5_ARCLA|nr:hypothetical protein L6452_00889 [Arctium lappa]